MNMQVIWLKLFVFDSSSNCLPVMAPMKSAMKAKKVAMKAAKAQKVMTKGALLGELANLTEMKKADISKVLNTLTEIGTQEVKKSGKFVLPGLCMIKTRTKAAVKGGGTRMMFGKGVFWTSSAGRAENHLSWAGADWLQGWWRARWWCRIVLRAWSTRPWFYDFVVVCNQAHNLYSFCSTAVVFGGDRISTVRSPTFL